MSILSLKYQLETILKNNSISDTWDDILTIFDDELRAILFSGNRKKLIISLENYYSGVDFSSLYKTVQEVIGYETVVDPDPSNPIFFKATGSVASDGTLEEGAGATTSRISTGIYEIKFTTPANSSKYPILTSPAIISGTNDYMLYYKDRTVKSFYIEIRSQDDGSSSGQLHDMGFSFFIPIISTINLTK